MMENIIANAGNLQLSLVEERRILSARTPLAVIAHSAKRTLIGCFAGENGRKT